MGKDWDKFGNDENPAGGNTGRDTPYARNRVAPAFYHYEEGEMHALQEFAYRWSKEALRIVKPGAMMLCFGGTRTFHRIACGIEDAGWEIRDTMMWVYGCLSEDTEILTKDGWKHYHKDIVNDSVLCYNKDTDSFEFNKPTNKFLYENKNTAYRIKSDKTDQIVSRNHRVLIEQGGRKAFKRAEQLARQSEATIPVLESLSDLPETISNRNQRTSCKKQDLLERVQKQDDWNKKQRQKTEKTKMSSLWQNVLSYWQKQKQSTSNLFSSLQWDTKRGRMEKTCSQGTQELVRKKQTRIGRENDRKNQSCLEGWGNIFSQEGKLWKTQDKICEMSRRLFRYGSQGWLRHGASPISSNGIRETTEKNRGGSSRRSQSREQQDRKSRSIQEQLRPQEIRSRTGYKTTLATVEPIEYNGKVWCVQVPTGAFVARRNGKIFITGNSGFPKSHNTSKAIDKQAGAEREVVGTYNPASKYDGSKRKEPNKITWNGYKNCNSVSIEKPATSEAQLWDGWGTALKPAWEPIIVAMKPIPTTFAENALEWGVAGLNIDEGRVKHDEPLKTTNRTADKFGRTHAGGKGWRGKPEDQNVASPSQKGRWPANLIHDGSEEVVELFPSKAGGSGRASGPTYEGDYQGNVYGVWGGQDKEPPFYADSGSAARFFYCAKASRAERNKGLEGMKKRPSQKMGDGLKSMVGHPSGNEGNTSTEDRMARNDHPTVKPFALMKYLCRLTKTPTGGVVLDPFMGSGTTGMACKAVGRDFIGIELDEHYFEIAEKRINAPIQKELL